MTKETCAQILNAVGCDFEKLIERIYEVMDQKLRRGEYKIKNGDEIMVRIPTNAYEPYNWKWVAGPLVRLIYKRTKGEAIAYPLYDLSQNDSFAIVISKARSRSKDETTEQSDEQINPTNGFKEDNRVTNDSSLFKHLTRTALEEKFTSEQDDEMTNAIKEAATTICHLIDQKFFSKFYRKEGNAITFEITEVQVADDDLSLPFDIAKCVVCELKRHLYDENWSISYNYRAASSGLGKFIFTIEYFPTITPLT